MRRTAPRPVWYGHPVSVYAFLANRPAPRPNPGAPGRYRVAWRRLEGGVWETLAEADDEGAARDEVAAPRAPLGPGDLVRLHDDGRPVGLWVQTSGGLREAGASDATRLPSADWVEAWEGRWSEALGMARVATDSLVGPARLLAALGACAELAFPWKVDPDSASGRALALVARAARDDVPPSELLRAGDAARAELNARRWPPTGARTDRGLPPATQTQQDDAATAAVLLADLAVVLVGPNPAQSSPGGTTKAGDLAASAVNAIARAHARPYPEESVVALRTFASVFRKHVPLGVLLAARAHLWLPDPAP